MSRQPTELEAHCSPGEHLAQLRRRMIRETEAFLNTRIYGGKGGRPAAERAAAKLDPRGSHLDRRQMPARGESSLDIRTRPDWGTLIEVRPDQRGVVDDPRLQALEVQLAELTDDRTAGDIVVGVRQVAVMTAGFMSLLAMIRPRLACQKRKLSLYGLRPECASVLRGTGLEELL